MKLRNRQINKLPIRLKTLAMFYLAHFKMFHIVKIEEFYSQLNCAKNLMKNKKSYLLSITKQKIRKIKLKNWKPRIKVQLL